MRYPNPTFSGYVDKGKLKITNEDVFRSYVARLKGEVEIIVRKKKSQRSIRQNSLYWMYIGIISDALGYDTEEMHSTFKAMYLTDKSGKLPIVRSTTALNKIEFGEYIDKIVRKSAELGIILPDPQKIDEI